MTRNLFFEAKIKDILARFQGDIQALGSLAYVGAADGTINVPGRPNFIYVSNADSPAIAVFNKRVGAHYGQPVIIGFDPHEPNLLQVLSIGTPGADSQAGTTDINYYTQVGPHALSHSFLGDDPVFVGIRQINDGRVGPLTLYSGSVVSGSAAVEIRQAVVTIGDTTYELPTTAQDLSGYIPGSGSSCYVLITLSGSGVVTVTAGSTVDGLTPALTDRPPIPSGHLPLAAVRLWGGMSFVNENPDYTDILDLRSVFIMPQTSGSGGSGGPDLSNATPQAVGASGSPGASGSAARGDHIHAHGNQAGGSLHDPATTGSPGFMPALSGSPANFLNGSGVFSTPATATTAQTGYMPAPSGSATQYLDGSGNWSTPTSGSGGGASGSVVFHGCKVRNENGITTVTNTPTTPTFTDADIYDTDNFHDPSTNPERITVPFSGYYRINAYVSWAGTGTPTGPCEVDIFNLTAYSGMARATALLYNYAFTGPKFSCFYEGYLAAGTDITMTILQYSGGNLDAGNCEICIHYLGAAP